jgi:hypothetical protein
VADPYKKLDEKPYRSQFLLVETEIDHPVEAVWSQAVDIASWMTNHRLETLDGESGKVGHFERVYPTGLTDAVPEPHYHLYGIAEVVPNRLLVLEVFPERGGSYGDSEIPPDYVGFDNLLFTDLGGKTKLSALMIETSTADLSGSGTDEEKISTLTSYFDNLRALLDQDSA